MSENLAAPRTSALPRGRADFASATEMNMQRPENKPGGLAVAGAGHGERGEAPQRALAEAKERHRLGALTKLAAHREINGRGGPDPVRYGDWEVKGIASDF